MTVNRAEVAKIARNIQREFDKHPISIPINADAPPGPTNMTNVYNGPVIHGDANEAQLAWGNEAVHQTQANRQDIASGFEALALAVAKTLEGLANAGLDDDDREAAESAGRDVLVEMIREEPDEKKIKSLLRQLKGALSSGMNSGVTDSAHQWTKTAIEQLGSAF